MKKLGILFVCLLAICNAVSAQNKKLVHTSTRIVESPKIDGQLNDAAWLNAEFTQNKFITQWPEVGQEASEHTTVALVYDDEAIYIAAKLYAEHPDQILREFKPRDNDNANADFFSFFIDSYQSGNSAFGFLVSSAGVQSDFQFSNDNSDYSWNAVWNSAVDINDEGWFVEMRIPYSALRFPKVEVQEWGVNFRRSIRNLREGSNWNPMDPAVAGFANQFGTLEGIENIEPPLRLALTPYVSATQLYDKSIDGSPVSFRGGVDLRFGLNESYTVDMTLIPDFGQVVSDQQVLNLDFQEVIFDERRPFFLEGIDLYSRADLFYSRRIGRRPGKFWEVQSQLTEGQRVIENPTEAPLINATKLSGRGSKGLAVGFFNAVLNSAEAIIENEDGSREAIETEPFSNYNVFVLDQNLKNNGYFSIINTNVTRFGDARDANVIGTEFLLRNKANSIEFKGLASYNIISDTEEELENPNGFRSAWQISKIGGKFTYGYAQQLLTKGVDLNDFGISFFRNRLEHRFFGGYQQFEPKGKFNSLFSQLNLTYRQRLDPFTKENIELSGSLFVNWLNWTSTGLYLEGSLGEGKDFYEPRQEGRYNVNFPYIVANVWISPDYRKKYLADANIGIWRSSLNNIGGYWFGINPRARFSDRFTMIYGFNYSHDNNDLGYNSSNEADIFFANRAVQTVINTVEANYVFNRKMSISLVGRYYWRQVKNESFYSLNDDGNYSFGADVDDPGTTFAAFSSDLIYSYEFLPGSWITASWKWNSLFFDGPEIDYGPSFKQTLRDDPLNQFSVKILYYLDYQDLRRLKRKRT